MRIFASLSPGKDGYSWVEIPEITKEALENLEFGGNIAVFVRDGDEIEIRGVHYDFTAVQIKR